MIRVALPYHLRTLARLEDEIVDLDLPAPVTQAGVVAALEARWPSLRGTIHDPATRRRRPFLRFFACGVDLSNEPPDAALPADVIEGREPYLIVGAIAGG